MALSESVGGVAGAASGSEYRTPGAFRSTAVAVVAFGVAMGYLEAAVVLYLRSALGMEPSGGAPSTFGTFEVPEIARELATLVMIAAVSWPPSLETWDVLFLVPAPWVGPVWAPFVVSVALIAFGLAAARRLRASWPIVVGTLQALAGLAGGGLVIASFLVDSNRVMAGDFSAWTGWPVFWAGMALATAATVSAHGGKSTAPMRRDAHFQHGTGGRPSVDSPD